MYKHLSILAISILSLFATQASAQQRTYSPFSRYGIGDLHYSGSAQSMGMGNSGIALRSPNYLNSLNPASYSALDSMSFYFDAALQGFIQNIETGQGSHEFSNMNFDNFTMGFPISRRFFASIGLKPVSKTGYKITGNNQTSGNNFNNMAYGTGNFSKIYGGLSISPFKNFSAGVHLNYLFGNLKNLNYVESSDDPFAQPFAMTNRFHVNDLLIDLGVQYTLTLNETSNLTLGAVLSPKTAIKGTYTALTLSNATIIDLNELTASGDTVSMIDNDLTDGSFEMPMTFGLGAALAIDDKLTLSADFRTEQWSDANFPDPLTQTTDAWRLSTGAEWIPNYRLARNYFQRVRYRAGMHYAKDYLKINNNDIIDLGMSFGIGFPLKRSRTSVNINYEFGQRGDVSKNLMKESYSRFILSLTLHEYWFFKQKFD